MTKQISQSKKATRTAERALVFDRQAKRQVIERSIWEGSDGRKYIQYKGTFYSVHESDNHQYDYTLGFPVDFVA